MSSETSDRKIIHDLSDEELLAIASGAKVEKILEKVSEAAKFIYALKIREGRTKISAQLVYYTYKHWKGWNNKRESKGHFFRSFNKYFKPVRMSDGMHYWLDERSFDTSEENYWLMRKEARLEKRKTKKTEA